MQVARHPECEAVVTGIVGCAGLLPTGKRGGTWGGGDGWAGGPGGGGGNTYMWVCYLGSNRGGEVKVQD